MRHVTLVTTGGTIEKVYDSVSGTLENRGSIVRRMLRRLRLEDVTVDIVELMSKDSLFMTPEDRARILHAIRESIRGEHGHPKADAVIVLHGTDTLTVTGEYLHAASGWTVPVVLTGAMRPYEMKRSDALQNLTEALLASSLVAPGVYCVGHGRLLAFPGIVKDRASQTFVRVTGAATTAAKP